MGDNSGSMQMTDGRRIVPSKKKEDVRFVPCTRWDELKACIEYHIQMSALLEAPTIFRFLNDPGAAVGMQQFSIAENSSSPADILKETQIANSTLRKTQPGGSTPLTSHILEIQQSIMDMSPTLIQKGQRVAVIIATDGLPTDERGIMSDSTRQEFINALRLLEGLPVWVVIRLCTDEDDVVDFYNELDEQLELSLEVLDDFVAEGKEVHAFNPWLNYALPLHRCREMGFYDRLFDLLDERKFTHSELRDFCVLLFGEVDFDGVPDPVVDWDGFKDALSKIVNMESNQWHPIKKMSRPWIDIKMLDNMYGNGGNCGCTIM